MLPNNDISFQLWSSRKTPSLEEQLRFLKDAGYTDVQPYHDQYDAPEAFAALLSSIGLTAKSGHFELSMIDRDFDYVVSAAKALGMKLVVAPYLHEADRPLDRAGWEALGRHLANLTHRFADNGLDFAWHNHEFEFIALPDGSYPIEHLLGDAVSWEPDVAWITKADVDPLPWLEHYAGRIPVVHVKDVAPKGEKTDEDGWADVGTGVLPWDRYWPAAVATKPWLMVVEHDNPSNYRRFAHESMAGIRKLAAVR